MEPLTFDRLWQMTILQARILDDEWAQVTCLMQGARRGESHYAVFERKFSSQDGYQDWRICHINDPNRASTATDDDPTEANAPVPSDKSQ